MPEFILAIGKLPVLRVDDIAELESDQIDLVSDRTGTIAWSKS